MAPQMMLGSVYQKPRRHADIEKKGPGAKSDMRRLWEFSIKMGVTLWCRSYPLGCPNLEGRCGGLTQC